MHHAKLGIPLSEEHKKSISASVKEKFKDTPNYNKCADVHITIPKDELYQKYIIENLSLNKCAAHFNCSKKTIFTYISKYNIHKDKEVWKRQLSTREKKIVYQYDLEGNLLKIWPSVSEISNELKINEGNIANCCRGIAKTCGGYIWRYKDKFITLDIYNLNKKLRKIEQYDLEGNFLNIYNSITEAARLTNLNDGNIGACCTGKYKKSGGYIWKYSNNI